MERKGNPGNIRKNRLRNTLIWSAVVAAIVITLLVKEQIALLYVLATLSVTVLLVVVARADLGGSSQATTAATLNEVAALTESDKPTTSFASAAKRNNVRR